MPSFGNRRSILNPHPTAAAIAAGRTIHPRVYLVAREERLRRIGELSGKIAHQTATRKEYREYERIAGLPYPQNHLTVVQEPARKVALRKRLPRLAGSLSRKH
jgi:hypothetical protein